MQNNAAETVEVKIREIVSTIRDINLQTHPIKKINSKFVNAESLIL